MRKVFLNNLPKNNRNCINWKECIGKKVKFIYDSLEGEIIINNIVYKNRNYKIELLFNNKIYHMGLNEFKKAKIGRLIGIRSKEFKIEIGQIFKDKNRDIVITTRKYIKNKNGTKRKYYKYKCNKCGFDCGKHYDKGVLKNERWIEESTLLKGIGCSCCANHSIVPNINSIFITDKWMIPYIGEENAKKYSHSTSEKIHAKCPCCGDDSRVISISKIYNKRNLLCKNCSDGFSYPEKIVNNLLKELNIEFITQYSTAKASWCGKYRYDFYFEKNNEQYIVETHGEQHYRDNTGFKLSLQETQENDKNKYELAINNGIKPQNYIVIDCRKSELDFIKNNIINSKLNDIFDLNNIDWIKIEEKSLNNSLIREVCTYYKNNKKINKTQIANIFNITTSCVCNYIKKGMNLGWCI